MRNNRLLPVMALTLSFSSTALPTVLPSISDQQAEAIGRMLWKNECGATVEGLTSWNKGEAFASLGIGHFIWYPTGTTGPFQESFPALVRYLAEQGARVPEWILRAPGCPWPDRESFLSARSSPQMKELRQFLVATIGHQARFAAQRMVEALPKLLAATPEERRPHIRQQFERVAAHPHGLYCLVDYVNFKGEGTHPGERYQGQGWGLLQVLDAMQGEAPGAPALREFSTAATEVLRRRVNLSPPERGEQRWLAGWENRCRTYLPPEN